MDETLEEWLSAEVASDGLVTNSCQVMESFGGVASSGSAVNSCSRSEAKGQGEKDPAQGESSIRKSRVIIRPRHRMSFSRFNAQPSHSTLPFGHYYMYEWERPGPRGTTTWKPGFPLSTNGLLTGPFP
ncbi:hypothetical protein GBA52_015347 [Prunus armeniaca]|nr:hypothetical protein GBA52_015347 [Prunus armeniaca]